MNNYISKMKNSLNLTKSYQLKQNKKYLLSNHIRIKSQGLPRNFFSPSSAYRRHSISITKQSQKNQYSNQNCQATPYDSQVIVVNPLKNVVNSEKDCQTVRVFSEKYERIDLMQKERQNERRNYTSLEGSEIKKIIILNQFVIFPHFRLPKITKMAILHEN